MNVDFKISSFENWSQIPVQNAAFLNALFEEISLCTLNSKLNHLKTTIKAAIDFDDELCERAMKRRYSGQQPERTGGYVEYRTQEERISSGRSRRNNSDNSRIASMKLNVVLSKKSKCLRKRQSGKKRKSCYSCDKEDHFARDCRSCDLTTTQRYIEKGTQSRD